MKADSSEACATLLAALGDYFAAIHQSDTEKLSKVWHKDAILLEPSDTDPLGVCVLDAEAFSALVAQREVSIGSDWARHDSIHSFRLLDGTTAAASLQVALPSSAGPMLYQDILVLMNSGIGWQIISKASKGRPLAEALEGACPSTQSDVSLLTSAATTYMRSNREADADGMAGVFHAASRLTFLANSDLVIVPANDFIARVRDRWSVPMHAPYQHLRDDPRTSAHDSLLSIDLVDRDLAVVTLKVGFPPVLYTDILTFARLPTCQDAQGASCQFWIIAKSSINVPHLANEGEAE
mmetsp:Transcript_22877/g.50008  ORF Transcript_22877/g.50008 Transcript_22877/m.50008 type:complete len:295 (+) Transcript_22877:133-1017(+)